MKTKDLFCPDVNMSEALRQTVLKGLSRVEITYNADSVESQQLLLSEVFLDAATLDLDRAQKAVNRVQGLCWDIPFLELYEKFQAA